MGRSRTFDSCRLLESSPRAVSSDSQSDTVCQVEHRSIHMELRLLYLCRSPSSCRRNRTAPLMIPVDSRRSCKNSLLRRPCFQLGWSRPRRDFPPWMSHRPLAIASLRQGRPADLDQAPQNRRPMGSRSRSITPSPLALNGAYDRLSALINVHMFHHDPLLTTTSVAVLSLDQRHQRPL